MFSSLLSQKKDLERKKNVLQKIGVQLQKQALAAYTKSLRLEALNFPT